MASLYATAWVVSKIKYENLIQPKKCKYKIPTFPNDIIAAFNKAKPILKSFLDYIITFSFITSFHSLFQTHLHNQH